MRTDELGRRLSRLRGVPAPTVDAAIAVVFLLAVALDRRSTPVEGGLAMAAFSVVLTLTMAGALVVRRTFPLTAYLAGSVALCTEALAGLASGVSPYANLIGIYSLGLYATKPRARWGPLVAAVSVPVYFAGDVPAAKVDAIGVLFSWIATWAVGYSNARRREEQERARRAIRQQAVAEEQTRVARELHDVVGHTVNLLVVQAGAARLVLEKDPETARDLLQGMEQTGRDSLADLDHVLGRLRTGTGPSGTGAGSAAQPEPDPGVEQIPHLVERLTDSGLDVTLTQESGLRLPRNVDLSAYRIVQEALTNALKYAAPCSATVAIHTVGDTVVVEVADDGPGLPDPHVPGRGLLGIAERVSMCGGRLEEGRSPGVGS